MFKHLSIFLKQKKLLSFTLLSFVLIWLMVPFVTRAVGIFSPFTTPGLPDSNPISDIAGAAADALLNVAVAPFFTAITLAVAILLITIYGTLSNLAGGLLLYIISLNADPTWSYTHFTNPIIAIGWTEVRDLANMVVVLGFVVIGIATALRFKDYEAKKLLVPLIIAALLINFSLLICGIFIDGSNIITTEFLKGGGFLQKSVSIAIKDQVNAIWNNSHFFDITGFPELIGQTIAIVFFDIITLTTFFLYFFLFLFRYVFLWILVILSPLAFVFYVFPFTKKFFDMWWNNFLQWCTVGIAGAFFLFLADKLTEGITSSTTNKVSQASGSSMMGYLVPSAFLIGGLLFSMQSSAMGASMAVKAFKMVGRGAGKVGSAVLEKTGRTETGRATREKLTMAGAKFAQVTGFAKESHVADTKTKMREEHRSVAKGMTDEQVNSELTKTGGRGARGAAFIEETTSRKILGKGRTHQQVAGLLANAQEAGSPTMRSDAEKLDPRLAGSNKGKVEENLKKIHPSLTMKTATPAQLSTATKQAVRESTGKSDAVNLSSDALKDVDVQAGLNASKIKSIGRSGIQPNIDALKGLNGVASPAKRALVSDMKARGVVKGSAEYNQTRAMLKQIATDPNFA